MKSPTFSNLWIKLRDKAYRHAFVATQLKRGIPFQLRAMRKKLGLSQADLAQLAGVSQGVISRAEDPDYGNLTFNTVLRIAKGMDCAFVGRVVPFSDLAKWFDNLSEESVQVPTFEEELGMKPNRPTTNADGALTDHARSAHPTP